MTGRRRRLRVCMKHHALLITALPRHPMTEPIRVQLTSRHHEVAIVLSPVGGTKENVTGDPTRLSRPYSADERRILDVASTERATKARVLLKRAGLKYGPYTRAVLRSLEEAGCLRRRSERGGYLLAQQLPDS